MYRLRTLWPEYGARVRIAWKPLALEIKNRQGMPKHIVDQEVDLLRRLEPELPIGPWSAPDWTYPPTSLPAFEAIACAEEQGDAPAWEFSWSVRAAFFAQSCCVALRHVLADVARESGLDVERFTADWDSGRHRLRVLADSHHGWEEITVQGSPTFVLPNGRHVHNPAAARIAWSSDWRLESVEWPPPDAPEGDWRPVYRTFLDEAAAGRPL